MDNALTVSATTAVGSPHSSDDNSDGPCSCCKMVEYYKCGLEELEWESNENYRRRYLWCPQRVSIKVGFFGLFPFFKHTYVHFLWVVLCFALHLCFVG